MSSPLIDNCDIESVAHALWDKQGRPEGRALEHWLEAESLIAHQTRSLTRRLKVRLSQQVRRQAVAQVGLRA